MKGTPKPLPAREGQGVGATEGPLCLRGLFSNQAHRERLAGMQPSRPHPPLTDLVRDGDERLPDFRHIFGK